MEGCDACDAVAWRRARCDPRPTRKRERVAVGEHHALGHAGRARGVEQVGEIVGVFARAAAGPRSARASRTADHAGAAGPAAGAVPSAARMKCSHRSARRPRASRPSRPGRDHDVAQAAVGDDQLHARGWRARDRAARTPRRRAPRRAWRRRRAPSAAGECRRDRRAHAALAEHVREAVRQARARAYVSASAARRPRVVGRAFAQCVTSRSMRITASPSMRAMIAR